MARVLLDQVIDTDYGQFDLLWTDDVGFDGEFARFFADQENGLVGAASSAGLYLNLARRSGGSPVRIVLLDEPPGEPDPQWEDVVEVSTTIPEGAQPSWSSWAGEDGGPLDLPPGTYRVRVLARGRDAGRDGELEDDAVDFYLVELWEAPSEQDAILRTGSEDATYWHGEVGGNR